MEPIRGFFMWEKGVQQSRVVGKIPFHLWFSLHFFIFRNQETMRRKVCEKPFRRDDQFRAESENCEGKCQMINISTTAIPRNTRPRSKSENERTKINKYFFFLDFFFPYTAVVAISWPQKALDLPNRKSAISLSRTHANSKRNTKI